MKITKNMLREMIEEEIENYQAEKEEGKKIAHDHEGKMAKGELRDMIKNSLIIYKSFDKNNPLKKSKLITHLKIQMGLSCNYSCDYCSQKFVERMPETFSRISKPTHQNGQDRFAS